MKQEGEIQTFKGDTGTVRNEEDQESVIIGTKVETVAFVNVRQDREFEKLRKSPCIGQIVKMRGTLVG